MTFDEWFAEAVYAYNTDTSGLRYGQAVLNSLHTYRPDLSMQVTNTDLDPYYDDSRLASFLEAVERFW